MPTEHDIEMARLRRHIADRNDFLTRKNLWREFCDFRPSDERKEPERRDVVDRVFALLRWKN
jgi:hypothetical protein